MMPLLGAAAAYDNDVTNARASAAGRNDERDRLVVSQLTFAKKGGAVETTISAAATTAHQKLTCAAQAETAAKSCDDGLPTLPSKEAAPLLLCRHRNSGNRTMAAAKLDEPDPWNLDDEPGMDLLARSSSPAVQPFPPPPPSLRSLASSLGRAVVDEDATALLTNVIPAEEGAGAAAHENRGGGQDVYNTFVANNKERLLQERGAAETWTRREECCRRDERPPTTQQQQQQGEDVMTDDDWSNKEDKKEEDVSEYESLCADLGVLLGRRSGERLDAKGDLPRVLSDDKKQQPQQQDDVVVCVATDATAPTVSPQRRPKRHKPERRFSFLSKLIAASSSPQTQEDQNQRQLPECEQEEEKAAEVRALRLELESVLTQNARREEVVSSLRRHRSRLRDRRADLEEEGSRHEAILERTEYVCQQIRYVIDVRCDEVYNARKRLVRTCAAARKVEQRWYRNSMSSSCSSPGVREDAGPLSAGCCFRHLRSAKVLAAAQRESSWSLGLRQQGASSRHPRRGGFLMPETSSRSVLSAPATETSCPQNGIFGERPLQGHCLPMAETSARSVVSAPAEISRDPQNGNFGQRRPHQNYLLKAEHSARSVLSAPAATSPHRQNGQFRRRNRPPTTVDDIDPEGEEDCSSSVQSFPDAPRRRSRGEAGAPWQRRREEGQRQSPATRPIRRSSSLVDMFGFGGGLRLAGEVDDRGWAKSASNRRRAARRKNATGGLLSILGAQRPQEAAKDDDETGSGETAIPRVSSARSVAGLFFSDEERRTAAADFLVQFSETERMPGPVPAPAPVPLST